MATSNNDQFRILVLEDDLISQVSASQVIQRAAPECILLMARSLAEGRRLLGKYQFHLCVLDIQLPDGSGIDFLYDIQVSSPHACVAILTGVPLPHYRDQAEAFGVLHFMAKPLNYQNLVAIVKESRMSRAISEEETSLFDVALSRLSVLDIIQLKCLNNTTQVMEFNSTKHGSGQVYFRNGEIIHAETVRSKGMAALSEIIGWKGGHAAEVPGSSTVKRTIMDGWQTALLTAAQAADEKGGR
jgi:response regulator RpfG family c-di-GMP phosphodiesterase